MNACPHCGGEIVYHGLCTVECRTVNCPNGPKMDVPDGWTVGWYYLKNESNGLIEPHPFLKKLEK